MKLESLPLNFAHLLSKSKFVHFLNAIRSVILKLYHISEYPEWPNKTQIPEFYP